MLADCGRANDETGLWLARPSGEPHPFPGSDTAAAQDDASTPVIVADLDCC